MPHHLRKMKIDIIDRSSRKPSESQSLFPEAPRIGVLALLMLIFVGSLPDLMHRLK